MTRRRKGAKVWGGVLCSVLLGACASALRQPTGADVEVARASYADASLEQLVAGRTLYVGRCAGCHALKTPREVPRARWRSEVRAMRQEHAVALSDAEAEAIVRYLETLSAE